MVSDEALRAGVRRMRGDARLAVRVESRTPLSRTLGGSGARFERVRLEVDGRVLVGVLKQIEPDPICVTRERRFYEELAAELRARIPRAFASGELEGRLDGWVLLEEFPPGRRWRPARAHDVAREIARVHRATLGRVPDWLPRPFPRDLVPALAHVPEGLDRLEALQRREPLLRELATPRAFALARALIADLAPLARELARSPECVVHRDLHHGNVWLPAEGAPILFDWKAVSAGPPIFDLTLLHQYLSIRQIRIPGRDQEIGFYRARTPSFRALERSYLDALGNAPREAIAAGANAAFIWEALYRLGWVASQLEQSVPRFRLCLVRIPGLRALGHVGDRAAVCAAWQAMFVDFERRAAGLLG